MADNHRLLELAKDGDRDARDKLVTDNMGLVVSVARRYVGRGQELEDLIQIGLIGLIKAVDRFDLEYDVNVVLIPLSYTPNICICFYSICFYLARNLLLKI